MQEPRLPANEDARLAALRRRAILDTAREAAFDELVELASVICAAPMAAITLIDRHRQWFKAAKGMEQVETPRSISFCGHTILRNSLTIVPDSRTDPRFADNPLVTGSPRIRSYAGAPLRTGGGHRIGSLCVMDTRPRDLTPAQLQALRMLGVMAMRLIDARCAHVQREESDRRFLLTVDTAPALIWLAGPDQRFLFLNKRWQEFTGRPLEQELGAGWSDILHPDDLSNWSTAFAAAVAARRDLRLELRLRQTDGSYRWLDVVATPHVDREGLCIGMVGVCLDVTQQKRLKHKLLHVTSMEQRKLAGELHDGLGQELTGLALLAAAIEKSRSERTRQELLNQLKNTANRAINTCRAISKGLSPLSSVHGGLLEALQDMVTLQVETYRINARLEIQTQGKISLPDQAQDHLFRIAQEAVNNARRHARAGSISVSIDVDGSSVALAVRDDGVGMAKSAQSSGGLGLQIMRFRAALVGARLTIERGHRCGTVVRCVCPQPRLKTSRTAVTRRGAAAWRAR